jgi:hypothetical protein
MRAHSSRSFKTLSVLVLLLVFFFWAFFDISKKAALLAVVNPFADDPYDAVGSFGLQLALFAVLLSLLRAFRPYYSHEIPASQRLLILRGETVAVLSIVVTLTADLVAMVRYPLMWRNSRGGWVLLALMGIVIFLAVLTGLWLYRLGRNISVFSTNREWVRLLVFPLSVLILAIYPADLQVSIPGGIFSALLGMALLFLCAWALATVIFPPAEMRFKDVLDDFASIYQAAKPRVRALSGLGRLTSMRWLRGGLDWLNPRRHRWNLIVIIALAMGVALLFAEFIHEGVAASANVVLLVSAVFIGIEGLGVILGYFLFAEFLGIFRKE